MFNSDIEKCADQVVAECLDWRWLDLAEERGWDEGLIMCRSSIWCQLGGESLSSFVVFDERSGFAERKKDFELSDILK